MTIVKSLRDKEADGFPHRVHRSKKGRKNIFGQNGVKAARRIKIKKWELKHGVKWKSSDTHNDTT